MKTPKQLRMEIKGCDKQLLTFFLLNLGAKSASGPSYVEGVRNYGKSGGQVQLQIFPVSPGR